MIDVYLVACIGCIEVPQMKIDIGRGYQDASMHHGVESKKYVLLHVRCCNPTSHGGGLCKKRVFLILGG